MTSVHLPRPPLGYFLAALLLLGLPLVVVAETPAPSAPSAQTEPPAQQNQSGRVARAVFTSEIVDREPVDSLNQIPNSLGRIYFFTDLRELEGQIVTHHWEYQGEVMAEVKFKVGAGPRWRVYSSKNLLPEWLGKWTVVVTNQDGWPVKASIFEYVEAALPTGEGDH